jgi:nicotinamide mononucleotide transporter
MADWLMLHGWEALAVLLGLAYLLLIIRQRVLGWPAAIGSASIYTVLMFEAALYMQSVLQLFYVVTAIYGWWHWHRGAGDADLPVVCWRWSRHVPVLAMIGLLGGLSGWLLATRTDAAFPSLDALTAWGAVVTTWMVARKVLENWYYWLVIDAVALGLYAAQGLCLTAGLFAVYLILAVVGLRQWRASMSRVHA